MNVKIVKQYPGKALVQWFDDGLHRGVIPDELIIDNQVPDDCLSLAIPYGIDFELALESVMIPATPKILADELHRQGIWTERDLNANPNLVQIALMNAYGIDFQTLLRIAHGG